MEQIGSALAVQLLYDFIKDFKEHRFPDLKIDMETSIGAFIDLVPTPEKNVQNLINSVLKELKITFKTPNVYHYTLKDGSEVTLEFHSVSTIDDVDPEDLELTFPSLPPDSRDFSKTRIIPPIEILPLITRISLILYLVKPKSLESMLHAYRFIEKILENLKQNLPHTSSRTTLYLYVEKKSSERIRKILESIKDDELIYDEIEIEGKKRFEILGIDSLKIDLIIKNLKSRFHFLKWC